MAFSSEKNIGFGGNSSCTVLDIDGHIVVLDCGSGLLQFYEDNRSRFAYGFAFDILLTHLHLDHIIGFSVFPPILSKDSNIRIFTRSRNHLPLIKQVFGVFRPPYWPVDFSEITNAKVMEITGEESFELMPGIKVTPFFTELHDKTSVFRIDADKSVVYMLDYEIKENQSRNDELVHFCTDADLIIFDASYLPVDYPPRRGWGHSTYEDGITLAKASGCKKMVFSHLSQEYSDEVLDSVETGFDRTKFSIAYDRMVIEV